MTMRMLVFKDCVHDFNLESCDHAEGFYRKVINIYGSDRILLTALQLQITA